MVASPNPFAYHVNIIVASTQLRAATVKARVRSWNVISCLFWNVTTFGMYKGLWMSWHAETGATLSENHVHSVGGVAFEARR